MNITQVATKPELCEIVIDDDKIVEIYGEPITFWMYDHININTYFDFYKFQSERDSDALMEALRKIILNAEGKPALTDDTVLPVDVTIEALGKINDHLGKSKAKLSKKEVGIAQE